jgi:hypothetical protein
MVIWYIFPAWYFVPSKIWQSWFEMEKNFWLFAVKDDKLRRNFFRYIGHVRLNTKT